MLKLLLSEITPGYDIRPLFLNLTFLIIKKTLLPFIPFHLSADNSDAAKCTAISYFSHWLLALIER